MTLLSNSSLSDLDCQDGDNLEYDWREVIEYGQSQKSAIGSSETNTAQNTGVNSILTEVAASELADRIEIECDPKLAIGYNGFAHNNCPLQDYPAALVAINLAIEYDPERTALYYQRALIAKALNDYPQVLADCQQLLNRDPQHPTVRSLYSVALVRTKDDRIAPANFDRHLELYPQDPHGYCYRGICYDRLKEHDRLSPT